MTVAPPSVIAGRHVFMTSNLKIILWSEGVTYCESMSSCFVWKLSVIDSPVLRFWNARGARPCCSVLEGFGNGILVRTRYFLMSYCTKMYRHCSTKWLIYLSHKQTSYPQLYKSRCTPKVANFTVVFDETMYRERTQQHSIANSVENRNKASTAIIGCGRSEYALDET